jgi:hypothetical protein
MNTNKKTFTYRGRRVEFWNNGHGYVFQVKHAGEKIEEIDGEETYYETQDQVIDEAKEAIDDYLDL